MEQVKIQLGSLMLRLPLLPSSLPPLRRFHPKLHLRVSLRYRTSKRTKEQRCGRKRRGVWPRFRRRKPFWPGGRMRRRRRKRTRRLIRRVRSEVARRRSEGEEGEEVEVHRVREEAKAPKASARERLRDYCCNTSHVCCSFHLLASWTRETLLLPSCHRDQLACSTSPLLCSLCVGEDPSHHSSCHVVALSLLQAPPAAAPHLELVNPSLSKFLLLLAPMTLRPVHSPPITPSPRTGDEAIRSTDDDAALSRLSCTNAGYLDDPFARHFVRRPTGRPPLINLGTFLRTWAMDKLVDGFLDAAGAADTSPRQILSVGAGTDTRFFRLWRERQAPEQLRRYVEVDFPETTARKAQIIKNQPGLTSCLGEDIRVGALRCFSLGRRAELDGLVQSKAARRYGQRSTTSSRAIYDPSLPLSPMLCSSQPSRVLSAKRLLPSSTLPCRRSSSPNASSSIFLLTCPRPFSPGPPPPSPMPSSPSTIPSRSTMHSVESWCET